MKNINGPVNVKNLARYLENRLNLNVFDDPFQLNYLKALIDPTSKTQAVFCDAAAGTGKTSLAIATAYYLLLKDYIDQIIYVRNAVSIRDQGFLPGDIEQKEAPYMQPGLDALSKLDPKNHHLTETLMNNKQLIISSTSFLRGVDWDGRKMLIVDEAQNLNLQELQTVLTRPHDQTKVVVIGSSLQCDNGLRAERFNKNQWLPFQLYAHYFNEFTSVPVAIIKLHYNYRGCFSQYADKINEIIKYYQTSSNDRPDKIDFKLGPTPEDLLNAHNSSDKFLN